MNELNFDAYTNPNVVMDPRNLGAMQPNRLSASRSFMAKMIREKWNIEREMFELDAKGNGFVRYAITTPGGALTFIGFLQQPKGDNRTGRIIGTSWDMIGALLDGVATPEQVQATRDEMPRLYEGRATPNTLVWFRSNQSLRIFNHVRTALASGQQPQTKEIRKVGYLMRNTGLDGNGTFGTIPFAAIPTGHPLKTSYHAQMLAAYLMRELSVDAVEELARIDSPSVAVKLAPSIKNLLGVGNGSALGLAMLFYNRPVLVNAYISAYLAVLGFALSEINASSTDSLSKLELLLDRTIRYRAFLPTQYRFFTSNMEIAADLRRLRSKVRAAIRGELQVRSGETALGAIHRQATGQVSKEALHSFESLVLELVPEHCDRVAEEYLDFDETMDLDPTTPLAYVRGVITSRFAWALDFPVNDEKFRDRVWYQSRAAEEPRSGPREEVPLAHELIQNYHDQVSRLLSVIDAETAKQSGSAETIGMLVGRHPDLEYIARLVLSLQDMPYATAHADPHDTDFVPVWVIRFVNSFIHGLDRTEDHMGRDVRALIFESAPYRDELTQADPSGWWWSYRTPTTSETAADAIVGRHGPVGPEPGESGPPTVAKVLEPIQSPITPPAEHATATIDLKYREFRLMAGRAYQALNIPEGSWQGAREFFMTAVAASTRAAESFGNLLLTEIDPQTAQAATWQAPTYSYEPGLLVIDNRGQSLLSTGHVVANIIGGFASDEVTKFELQNTDLGNAVPGLALELSRYGIRLEGCKTGTFTLNKPTGPDDYRRIKDEFLRNGRTLDSAVFWNIYYRGNAGLDADTPISRQHTGGTVLDVIRPGEKITKQFTSEELHLLTDPDELDSKHIDAFLATN